MKIFITTLLCFLLFSAQLFSISYRTCIVKITDKDSILEIFEGSDIWDPGVLNRPELENAIRHFLKSSTKKFITVNTEDIIKNLPIYAIEYAGIIKDGKKLIVCQMSVDEDYEYDSEDTDGIDFDKFMVCPKNNGVFEKNGFSGRLDGGCNVVELSYDPKKKEIINLYCNGVA